MAKKVKAGSFLFCVKNDKYPVSLEVRKVYQAVPDTEAGARKMVRVIDESGEDYLYPKDYFIPIELPRHAKDLFARSS